MRGFAALAATALVAGCGGGDGDDPPAPASTTAPAAAPGLPTRRPPDSPTPLGTATARETPGAAYAFLATQDGSDAPVTFDPCRTIRVVVNSRTAPADAPGLLDDAIEELAAASGFRFRVEGPSDEAPSADRPPFQRDRYGDRWAPVLVAWSDPVESAQLAGDVAGAARTAPLRVPAEGVTVYVSGTVVLDGPQLAELVAGPDGYAEARAVVLHELGHLLGLGHVDDPTQLMHGTDVEGVPRVTALGAGDLSGIARLRSSARCVDQL